MSKPGPKPGITLERHAEIGAELAGINDRLVTLSTEIANAYPRSSRAARAAGAFGTNGSNPLLRLRCELENAMFAQHAGGAGHDGGPPGCDIFVYWPRAQDRRDGGAAPSELRAAPALPRAAQRLE